MTTTETAAILRQLHDWLRGGTQWAPTRGAEAVEAAVEMIERREQETAALRAKVERMTQRLRMILEEPKESMSDSKALREMVRQARLALEESK